VRLEPRESQIVVLDESDGKGLEAHPVYKPEWDGSKPLLELASGWSLRFPDQATSISLTGLPDWRELRTGEIYSGYASYQCSFSVPASAIEKAMCLDLGMVGEVARVWINGTLIEVLLWPPYRVDMGGHLKPGLNQVLVEVGNNISCRMDGSWKPSGLLGPVRLLQGNQPSETGRAR